MKVRNPNINSFIHLILFWTSQWRTKLGKEKNSSKTPKMLSRLRDMPYLDVRAESSIEYPRNLIQKKYQKYKVYIVRRGP